VHTSAWQADEVLTELEKRQAKQEDEIKSWEKHLATVEKRMQGCTEAMHNNVKVVGEDVKKIGARLDKLLEGSNA
jgi:nuclear migration protein JNM1